MAGSPCKNVSGAMVSEKQLKTIQVRVTMYWYELLRTVGAGDHGKGWMDLQGVTGDFLWGVMSCLHNLWMFKYEACKQKRVLPLSFAVLKANMLTYIEGLQHISKEAESVPSVLPLFLLWKVSLRQWSPSERITYLFLNWLKMLLFLWFVNGRWGFVGWKREYYEQSDVNALGSVSLLWCYDIFNTYLMITIQLNYLNIKLMFIPVLNVWNQSSWRFRLQPGKLSNPHWVVTLFSSAPAPSSYLRNGEAHQLSKGKTFIQVQNSFDHSI